MAGDISRENGRKSKNGGRPKLEATKFREALIAEIEGRAKELAKALVDKALDGESAGDVAALREVGDRGLGKPVQGIDHTTKGESLNNYDNLTDEQLENVIAARARRTGGPAGGEGATPEVEPAEVRPAAQEAG